MSTSKQVKHLIQIDAFGIRTRIKEFQKPRRDSRSKNKKVRG
jgi:hypothetical protein